MRILILGDSLPFPRPLKGQPLASTWPELLKTQLPEADVWLRATPRSCLFDVLREFHFFTDSLAEFDVIVIQTGIVDCAPRPYPRWLYKLIESLLGLGTLRRIERFAHRRLLWIYGRPWVSAGDFAAGIRELVGTTAKLNPTARLIFIPIAPPTRSIASRLRGIDRNATAYNAVLVDELSRVVQRNSAVIDPFADVDPLDLTIEDGHHLSTAGHLLIADAVATQLRRSAPPRRHVDLPLSQPVRH